MSQRSRAWTPLFAALLVVALAASIMLGHGRTVGIDALQVFAQRLSGSLTADDLSAVVVFDLRFPRALLAALLGAALGSAGAVTQGLFRNPMAEPGVLGVGAGAAALAVLAIVLGLDALGLWVVPLFAAVGAVGVLVLLFAIAGRSSTATLLLSGVALAAFCGAFVALLLALAGSRWEVGVKVVQWLMGSFEGRGWGHLGAALAPCLVGFGLAAWLSRDLDALHLGDETAASLGVSLAKTKALAIACVGLLVGTATAIPGVIGFVGLVVPHIARMLVGPGHRRLLPCATVLGALVLLAVDTFTRVLPAIDVPPGVVTSFFGAPFFLWLLRRRPEALA